MNNRQSVSEQSGAKQSDTQRNNANKNRYLDSDARLFVRRLLESKIADLKDVKKVCRLIVVDDDGFSLGRIAKGLVDSGVLTRWQRDMLLRGKKRGFFLGDYQLRRPIGRGAMSVVYQAEHRTIKRPVALKILPPDEADEAILVDRFKREANIAAQMDHTNVARVFAFEEIGNKYFMVMEYVDGLNLFEVVRRDGPLSVRQTLSLTLQIATGLAHIHERGVIHRDVKPTNLLRRDDGVMKIIDMGLAKMGWPEMQGLDPSRLVGTAEYVSPEQIVDCRQADARSDLYSLGCTMYFLLTGKAPFVSSKVPKLLAMHQSDAVPDVRATKPDCPDAVADLLKRLLAKRKDDRPRTANELVRQLRLVSESTRDESKIEIAPPSDTLFD